MKKVLLNDIFNIYNIENNILNKNVIKCLLKTMKYNNLAYTEGQYYVYDEEVFIYLIELYKKLSLYFDFYYSLKSDLILMFNYLLSIKNSNEKLSFNAFFCPGYNDSGGYKSYLGKTTIKKLKMLSDISIFLEKNNVNYEINCYYCDSYIENCNEEINKNWLEELNFNKSLFYKEAQKYFKNDYIHSTSDLDIFKNEREYNGHIDINIINSIPKKIYNSFYISNKVFYKKLNFSDDKIKDRNDKLVTMYIMVSNYINSLKNGIYLPMENMYDREKIIANNNTCTMYLIQKVVKKYE